jgi:hypothetical protein
MNQDTNREDRVERNQCDGCMQGAAIRPGSFGGSMLHTDRYGRAFMVCERERYVTPKTCLGCGAKPDPYGNLPCGH